MRLDDWVILGDRKNGSGTMGYNEQQIVYARNGVSPKTGEGEIYITLTNGTQVTVSASMDGAKTYDELKIKYFDPTRITGQ